MAAIEVAGLLMARWLIARLLIARCVGIAVGRLVAMVPRIRVLEAPHGGRWLVQPVLVVTIGARRRRGVMVRRALALVHGGEQAEQQSRLHGALASLGTVGRRP